MLDSSIYEKYRNSYTQFKNNTQLVLQYIKIHFTQLVYGVNFFSLYKSFFYKNIFIQKVDMRYSNSLIQDPNIKISVRLKNILIFTVCKFEFRLIYFIIEKFYKSFQKSSDTPWTNSSLIGVPGYPTYNGVKTLLVSGALNLFTKTMENNVFPFSYDHAVAITGLLQIEI